MKKALLSFLLLPGACSLLPVDAQTYRYRYEGDVMMKIAYDAAGNREDTASEAVQDGDAPPTLYYTFDDGARQCFESDVTGNRDEDAIVWTCDSVQEEMRTYRPNDLALILGTMYTLTVPADRSYLSFMIVEQWRREGVDDLEHPKPALIRMKYYMLEE